MEEKSMEMSQFHFSVSLPRLFFPILWVARSRFSVSRERERETLLISKKTGFSLLWFTSYLVKKVNKHR